MPPIIETEALTKRYGANRAIEDISISVEPGADRAHACGR
jgi:hypothetical protein